MNDAFMNTYHRLPVIFAKGEGAWLTDIDGKKYLDFCSGIAVNCLGHAYPPLVEAISEQAARLNHTCNYFLSDTTAAFAEKLIAACAGAGMKKVFLANSGAEANEGACKVARKYSLAKYGPGRAYNRNPPGQFSRQDDNHPCRHRARMSSTRISAPLRKALCTCLAGTSTRWKRPSTPKQQRAFCWKPSRAKAASGRRRRNTSPPPSSSAPSVTYS